MPAFGMMGAMLFTYLAINAVLYAAFAIWCTMAPRSTASWLGLAPTGPGGESEYLAVYGGLQGGLAVFYGLACWQPGLSQAALLLSVAIYGGLVAMRSGVVWRRGLPALGNARFAYGLELGLWIAAVLLLVGHRGG